MRISCSMFVSPMTIRCKFLWLSRLFRKTRKNFAFKSRESPSRRMYSANQPDSLPRTEGGAVSQRRVATPIHRGLLCRNRFLHKIRPLGPAKANRPELQSLAPPLPTGRDGRRLITFFRNLGLGFAVVIENGHRSRQDSRQRRAQGSAARAQESSKRVPNSSRATPKRRWTPNCAERLRQQPIP